MRFLAKYGKYGVCVQHDKTDRFADGQSRTIQREIVAQFQPYGMRAVERELAMAHWAGSFNGFYQEMDEVTIVPPDYRIGVFDSEESQIERGWSDAERELVERTLIENARITTNVLVVPLVVVPPPWPNYDDYTGTVDELLRKLVEDGHDLSQTLEYEKGTQRRPDVLAGLQALVSDPDAVLELTPALEEIAG